MEQFFFSSAESEMETIQRRGDLSWFKALEKHWENRPQPPSPISTPRSNPNRERLVEFYQRHNPSKLDDVDKVLAKYEGKEEELFEKLERRYVNQYPSPPDEDTLQETNAPVCFLQFSESPNPVKIRLFSDITPLAAENFRQLCCFKYRSSKIHRIVPGMCIQGGDYNGTGGRSIYPTTQQGVDLWGNFPDETFLSHDAPGLLSMANNGKNRNGSQFFITLAPTRHLDGKHVVFGRVIENLNVVLDLGTKPTNEKEQPLEDITIIDCGEIQEDGQTWQRASVDAAVPIQQPSPPPLFGESIDADTAPEVPVFGHPPNTVSQEISSMGAGSSTRLGVPHEKSSLRFGSATKDAKDATTTSFGGFGSKSSFGNQQEISQSKGNDLVDGTTAFSFGGSQQVSSNAPGTLLLGSTTAINEDKNISSARKEETSKATFGGMVEGLSFGSLAVSGNAEGAFGNTSADTPSPFQKSSSTAFSGLSTQRNPAESEWFSNAAAESSKNPLAFSSPQRQLASNSSLLFGAALNESRGDSFEFRKTSDDSESTRSEDSDGSEYVDNSAQDDKSDEDVFDEYHYTSGDEEIAGLQPKLAKTELADTETATKPPSLTEAFTKKSGDNVNADDKLPVSGIADQTSIFLDPKNATESKAAISTVGRSPLESNAPPELSMAEKNTSRQQVAEVAPPKVPSEVVCEHMVSVDTEALSGRQLPTAAKKLDSKVPDEVFYESKQLPAEATMIFADVPDDDRKPPNLVRTDTMPVDNTTELEVQSPLDFNKQSLTDKNRPPERIEFEAGEKSSNVSFESQDAFTANGSQLDEYDRFARRSVGGETIESEFLNSIATVDSSVSGQAELLRRDIEVCSLDIKEALRRVERQKERLLNQKASSLTNTPTRFSRSLLPPQPHNRPQSLGKETTLPYDIDPASRFVYLSRIANKFSSGARSRLSLPDDLSLRREASSYTSPVLVQDDELETMQRESRSVQPLVETFERWTKDHVEKQKKDNNGYSCVGEDKKP